MGRQMINKMRRNYSDMEMKNDGICDLTGKCQTHSGKSMNQIRVHMVQRWRTSFMVEALCYGFLCTETGKTKRKISSGIEICATPLGCCPVETHICQTSANAKEDLGFPHCVCQ